MVIFLAFKGVIDDIQAMLSRTWWSRKDKGRFWTMIPWKTLCKLKGIGGLGIRDVRLFNLALLGRQVWRLLNNTYSLCFKVLSSKYFPNGNIFHAKNVDKASFTWSSIAAAVEVFKDGFGWQVGNGEKINIWADNWGMEGHNRDVVISNTLNHNVKSVKDLWHVDRRSWDVNKVKQAYEQDWAYSWLLLKEMGYGPHRFFWRALWKLDTLQKVRVFTWQVGHEILLKNGKIRSSRPGFNKGCSRCGAEVETLLHALRDCPTSRAVLSIGGWSNFMLS
ncbi:uncharacterized mitochondrial protein AtMg00310-like [Gossypium arboreum]|uniref:uncharacterized mitochondrial protein AtMg00310-like n=1 Tax=Gossypium arboreum TaxID=29729 RepID=UPI000819415F|nr:uncharacterized mitochondrial protein AtMg00310-like [Gossypium arboreum]